MQQGKLSQLLLVILLAGTCTVVAISGLPRLLAAMNADEQTRLEASQEIASATAAAVDKGDLSPLPAVLAPVMRRYQTVAAVQIVSTMGESLVALGDAQLLKDRLAAQAPEVRSAKLIRAGHPWGTIYILFTSSAALSALHPDHPLFWVIAGLAIVGLPVAVSALETIRRRLDRSSTGPMAIAAERAHHTLDTLAEGVVLMDPQGRILFANTAFSLIVGSPRHALIGIDAATLAWREGDTGRMPAELPWMSLTKTRLPIQGVPLGIARGESTRLFIVNGTPLFHKRRTLYGVLITLDDVTELEQSRSALKLARDAAEHANASKSHFLAMMSHEIRTPLNGVCGSVQLLKRTSLGDKQLRYADAASFSASTLLHLINDILDFSKIEAGQLALSPVVFELEQCIDDTMLMMVQNARAKGLCLAYEIEGSVWPLFEADPDRIRQILINLVNNAIKFTQQGAVSLGVGVERDDAERQLLRCAVADTGIGIAPDKLGRLFKPFSQVDSSTSRRYGGTGLGLVISKQLCELMGGRIEVTSVEGTGTTFTCYLDITKGPVPPRHDPEPFGVSTVVLVGLHPLEERTARRVLAAGGVARVTVCDNDQQLSALGNELRALESGSTIAFLLATTTVQQALAKAQQIRHAWPSDTIRVLAATFEQEHPITSEGIDRWLLRPLGARRLRESMAVRDKGVARVEPAAISGGKDKRPDLAGLRVLLAEDNLVGQMVVSDMLRDAGALCTTATNGFEVLAALQQHPFDILLMDCFMPDLDGFETTRRIRQLQEEGTLTQRPPIIALTAKAMRGDREACLQAGMDGYLTKPVDEGELLRTVATHAGRSIATATAATPAEGTRIEELCRRFGGKGTVLKNLLQAYRDTSAEDLGRIELAIAHQDGATLEQAAHRLAGGAGFVSASEVRRLAMDLEQRGSDASFAQVELVATALRAAVSESIRDLQEVMSRLDSGEATSSLNAKESCHDSPPQRSVD